jgi:predicted nuclease of predicted toxin-antitoxin system
LPRTTIARRTKSKKRSGTKPPEPPTFFVDRSLGRKLGAALIDAGVLAIIHDAVFASDTRDEEWLTRAGREGWIVLTKDKWIRKRPIEREALLAADVRAFVFTGGNMSGVEMAESIVSALPRMLQIVATTPSPFIARVTGAGSVELIEMANRSSPVDE